MEKVGVIASGKVGVVLAVKDSAAAAFIDAVGAAALAGKVVIDATSSS